MKLRGAMIGLLLAVVAVYFIFFTKVAKDEQGGLEIMVDKYLESKIKLTEVNLESLSREILAFASEGEGLPESLEALKRLNPAAGALPDPWGTKIRYERLSDSSFRLRSAGPDRIFDNADDIVKYEETDVEDAEVVVLSYGISSRVALRGIELAKAQGAKVGMHRLLVTWPFPEKRIAELSRKAKAIVVVEMNMGQMVREVERVVQGRCPVHLCGHPGGGVHDPKDIAEVILAARADVPAEDLRQAWEWVCLNQFHDIIPGSSIGPVYEESQQQYAELTANKQIAVALGITVWSSSNVHTSPLTNTFRDAGKLLSRQARRPARNQPSTLQKEDQQQTARYKLWASEALAGKKLPHGGNRVFYHVRLFRGKFLYGPTCRTGRFACHFAD